MHGTSCQRRQSRQVLSQSLKNIQQVQVYKDMGHMQADRASVDGVSWLACAISYFCSMGNAWTIV